ncbi:uncharacterized protein LOC116341292 [Contarinia nasturtii]|uniref:uncharacterized protein LOC116341292 n=1 Tax=Contarinia nasturtii TaxID=265458 RepID=UPI0012D47134|nr:uncharacterized protein LOC116341292 [Contarinia nasturtii]
MKVYSSENLANEMSLNGTAFQTAHLATLHIKNTNILRKMYYFLSQWTVDMLGDSSMKKCKPPITLGKVQIDKVRERYLAGLYAIADTNCSRDRFKRFEVAFIFFYNIAKRVAGTKKLCGDAVILREYERLVNKHFTDAASIPSPQPSRGKKLAIPFFRKRIPIPKFITKTPNEFAKYLQSKIKAVKGTMSINANLNAVFNEVSNDIINLYYYIFQYAPEKFVIDPFDDLVRMFMGNYLHSDKKSENNLYIISIAHSTFMRIFGPRKTKRVDAPFKRDDKRSSLRY